MKISNGKKWNNGDQSQLPVKLRRETVVRHHALELEASEAFKLLSAGGVSELGAVWADTETSQPLLAVQSLKTYWYTALFDPECLRLGMVLIIPERAMGFLEVSLQAASAGTLARFELTYSALNEVGNELFVEGLVDRMGRWLEGLAQSLQQRQLGIFRSAAPIRVAQPGVSVRAESAVDLKDMDVEAAFRLACPVAELDWIEDWQFDLLHSRSGRNEPHNVFLEPSSATLILHQLGANTYWYTTIFDPKRYQFQAVLLTRDWVVARWEFSGRRLEGSRVGLELRLTYSALGQAGSRLIADPGLSTRAESTLQKVLSLYKSYVDTGQMRRAPLWEKMNIMLPLLGIAVRNHFRRSTPGEIVGVR